jgi:cytochrome P450
MNAHVHCIEVAARKVLKPFTFSNGVTVPVGTTVSCPLYALHFDDDIYHDANQFEGFRFLETKNENTNHETIEARKTMYTTSKTYMTFGHGRHAWYATRFIPYSIHHAPIR